MKIKPLHPHIGAELLGLDARTIDDAALEHIRAALPEHSVLVLRDQRLSPAELVALTRRFGEPDRFQAHPHYPDLPEILPVSNRPEHGRSFAPPAAGSADRERFRSYWHTDGSYAPVPASLTLFYAVEVPEEGGDTLFVTTHTAYEALAAEQKHRLEGLRSVQPRGMGGPGGERVEHPLVRTHPLSGRKALYIDLMRASGIVGLDREEASALAAWLHDHYSRPEWIYRHQYREGDLVIWDNVACAHSATETPDPERHPRLMLRTTVRGGP